MQGIKAQEISQAPASSPPSTEKHALRCSEVAHRAGVRSFGLWLFGSFRERRACPSVREVLPERHSKLLRENQLLAWELATDYIDSQGRLPMTEEKHNSPTQTRTGLAAARPTRCRCGLVCC